jgi:protoporphyrinogen oxidase
MSASHPDVDLLVLGAGPAGLAAAWRAAERGLSVVLLEQSPRVGGMSGSFEVGGQRVDLGSHRLHPATPERVLSDLRRLLGDDLQLRRRNGRLLLGDTWVRFPLRIGELVRALPPRMVLGIGRDAVVGALRRPRADTYAEQIRAGLGPTVYRELYEPFAAKLWGLPGERIHGAQARVRVTADSPWKVLGRVLRGGRAGAGTEQGRSFYYPRRGFGQLTEALYDAATAAGAVVRTSTAAEKLVADGNGIRVLAGGVETSARRCFSTIPLPVLRTLVTGTPPDSSGLLFRAMVLVYLVHGGGRWTSYDAHYLPAGGTPVTRISEPANYRSSADDPADSSVVCAEIPCAVGDSIWESTDTELAGLVSEAVTRAGLPAIRQTGAQVVRLPRVYPVFDLDYPPRLAEQQRWVGSVPNVLSFGRLGLFAHDNSHHAIAEAYDAVDAIRLDGTFDTTAWRDAQQRFADHRVED